VLVTVTIAACTALSDESLTVPERTADPWAKAAYAQNKYRRTP
jgi:hypothetical protein